jgi:hypothetical protein
MLHLCLSPRRLDTSCLNISTFQYLSPLILNLSALISFLLIIHFFEYMYGQAMCDAAVAISYIVFLYFCTVHYDKIMQRKPTKYTLFKLML